MKIIGLTGGIGCGKSTVSEAFEALGVPVIDADRLSHALSEPHQLGWQAIVERWGDRFLRADQTIDRARLREAIFETPSLKIQLEACLHPLIFTSFEEQTELYRAKKAPYLIWSIPLLLESDASRYRDHLARILVVDAPVRCQLERVMARGISAETAQAILQTQVSRAVRQAAADDLLINIGTRESVARIVAHLHHTYLYLSR